MQTHWNKLIIITYRKTMSKIIILLGRFLLSRVKLLFKSNPTTRKYEFILTHIMKLGNVFKMGLKKNLEISTHNIPM